jgi:hypothetical protein
LIEVIRSSGEEMWHVDAYQIPYYSRGIEGEKRTHPRFADCIQLVSWDHVCRFESESEMANPLFSLWRALWRPTAPASRTKSRRTAEESRTRLWYESVKKCYLSKSTSTLLIHTISYRCHEKNCCRAGRGPIIATFYLFLKDYFFIVQ